MAWDFYLLPITTASSLVLWLPWTKAARTAYKYSHPVSFDHTKRVAIRNHTCEIAFSYRSRLKDPLIHIYSQAVPFEQFRVSNIIRKPKMSTKDTPDVMRSPTFTACAATTQLQEPARTYTLLPLNKGRNKLPNQLPMKCNCERFSLNIQ